MDEKIFDANLSKMANFVVNQDKNSLSSLENEIYKYEKLFVGTNTLYKITNNITNQKYVLKIYNKFSKIDHSLELSVIGYLSNKGKHPKVIISSPEYRIEEFIESPALDIFSLRTIPKLLKVVELISGLHNDIILKNNIEPLIKDKRPFILKIFEIWLDDFNKEYSHIKEMVKNTKYEGLIKELNSLFGETFKGVFSELLQTTGDIVLSHNDISPANLLCTNLKTQDLCLIDYEYCGLNYRGYDLAVLIEDIVTDYMHPEYPTFKMHNELKISDSEENLIIHHYIKTGFSEKSDPEIEFYSKSLKKEVTSCKIIFQLAGVLWGITTHDWTKSNFDENNCWRIEYAKQRWQNFTNHMKNYYPHIYLDKL